MARVRLFANLREAAGAALVEVPGATVAEVLDNAARAYGEEFSGGLAQAQVWVNGEPAEPARRVGEDDEVALIPPVSGGATAIRSAAGMQAALAVLVAATVTDLVSPEALVVALAAVGALWSWDAGGEARRTGYPMARGPLLAAVMLGAVVPYVLGLPGLGLVGAATVVVTLGWGVARPALRSLAGAGPTFAAALLVGIGTGSLVVARLLPEGDRRVLAFLAIVGLAGVGRWAVSRYPVVPYLDPLTASAVGAVLGGVVGGLVWGPGAITMLLVGVAEAIALIAGRAFGSLLRTGGVFLVEDVPGSLTALDGPLVAATLYTPLLVLLT